MKTELHYYDIFPKVFPAGKEIEITIKPLGYHADFENPENIYLAIYGLDDGTRHIGHIGGGEHTTHNVFIAMLIDDAPVHILIHVSGYVHHFAQSYTIVLHAGRVNQHLIFLDVTP